jgi:hypothetical protein
VKPHSHALPALPPSTKTSTMMPARAVAITPLTHSTKTTC